MIGEAGKVENMIIDMTEITIAENFLKIITRKNKPKNRNWNCSGFASWNYWIFVCKWSI